MSDAQIRRGVDTGEEQPSTGQGDEDLTGSGVVDSPADGGLGARHDSRLGGGGPVGADVGGSGGTGASGNALESEPDSAREKIQRRHVQDGET